MARLRCSCCTSTPPHLRRDERGTWKSAEGIGAKKVTGVLRRQVLGEDGGGPGCPPVVGVASHGGLEERAGHEEQGWESDLVAGVHLLPTASRFLHWDF